mgnify:FL=1
MWALFGEPPASATQIDGNLVRVASEWKSKAEQWAHLIRKKHDHNSSAYKKAIKLYIDAKGAADGWANQMLFDLRSNETAQSETYHKRLQDVSERAAAFVEYAEQLNFETKGPSSSLYGKLLKDLTEMGVTLYKTYHEGDMEKKKNIEKSIEALMWKAFDEA